MKVLVYDKYKREEGYSSLASLLPTDIIYLCLPTLYDETRRTYAMDELDSTLRILADMEYSGVILVKSTVLPGYCQEKNTAYPRLTIMHNPEFLTARTAAADFKAQGHIILGYTTESKPRAPWVESFYADLFPAATISVHSAATSALTKLAANSFYATKVQYFTELYLLCLRTGIDYETVKDLLLENGWINPMHTAVPGPDGEISFGGACLPKDISALNEYAAGLDQPHAVMAAVISERNVLRRRQT